jgi:hypothetical protein
LLLSGDAIFVTTALLLIGLPIWLFDVAVQGGFHAFSILTHVVSPALGLYLCRRLGVGRHTPIFTIGYYIILQIAARLFTLPADNINVAFDVYAPVKSLYPEFLGVFAREYDGPFCFYRCASPRGEVVVSPSAFGTRGLRPPECPLAGEAGRGTPQQRKIDF